MLKTSRGPLAALAVGLVLVATACSRQGGRQEQTGGAPAGDGRAITERITIAYIIHQSPGDTFWDIVR